MFLITTNIFTNKIILRVESLIFYRFALCRFRRKMWDEIQQSPGELSTLLDIFNRTSAIPHLEPQGQSVRSRDIGAMFPFCSFGSKHSSKALKERCYLFRRPKVTSNPQEACFTFNGNDENYTTSPHLVTNTAGGLNVLIRCVH